MDEEEEEKKFEMEENGEKEGKKRLDKEALCERLKTQEKGKNMPNVKIKAATLVKCRSARVCPERLKRFRY